MEQQRRLEGQQWLQSLKLEEWTWLVLWILTLWVKTLEWYLILSSLTSSLLFAFALFLSNPIFFRKGMWHGRGSRNAHNQWSNHGIRFHISGNVLNLQFTPSLKIKVYCMKMLGYQFDAIEFTISVIESVW